MARVAAPGEGRQPGAVPGRAHHEQVRAVTRIGHADTEFLENPHAPRADQVAARFGPGEGRLVDQCDAGARPGEHESGDAAAWAGAHHDRVPALSVTSRAHAGGFTGPVQWGRFNGPARAQRPAWELPTRSNAGHVRVA